MLETRFWSQTLCFWIWEIIWDHFQEPVDRFEGHEQGGGAVGGQGQPQGVNV